MIQKIWPHLTYFLVDFKLYLILLVLSFFLLLFFIYNIYESGNPDSRKKILVALVCSTFSIILVFCFFEAYFRYRYDQSDGLGFLNTNVRWEARHVIANNYQYRDRDFDFNKRSGTIRIGVVGDSLAEGYGIKDVKNRFSNLLEKKLNAAGFKVEVFNMGVAGLDTCSEIKEFDRVKQLNFDLIVWEYYLNDIQPCSGSTGSKILSAEFNRVNPVLGFLMDKSFLFDYLYWRLLPSYNNIFKELKNADLAQFKNPPVLASHAKDIASFSATLQENSALHKVFVIVFPILYLLNDSYPVDIHKQLDRVFGKNKDEVVDLLPTLIKLKNKNLTVNRFDAHPNEYVHSIAAGLLYDKIAPVIKVSIQGK